MRRVWFSALAAVVVWAAPSSPVSARQDPAAKSPRNASYQLRAVLTPATHRIEGSGKLIWRNVTTSPATELRLHLYWNAWRDTNSSWMREQQLGRSRSLARRPAEDFGGMSLTQLTLGRANLLPRAQFIAPDDGNADDHTVLAVPLEQPVAPGATIELEMAWLSTVPRTFARTGRLGDYYFVAQWFPKIGVFEETGWNTRQFHAATEFFADFGVYDVTLVVPRGFVVGATGRLMSTEDTREGVAHRFVQEDVHDFAWTTSPRFVEHRQRFEEPGLPGVDMRLLLQPEHAGQETRHFSATRAALKSYGTWFGPYPYGQITIVDPAAIVSPAQGESTGGMEYPTLFTAGTRIAAPWLGTQPESVTVHEAGHQFWYGIVATNEFDHAWMDEGLNTYSTARVLDEMFPGRFVASARYLGGILPWAYEDVRWSRAIDGNRLNAFRPVASSDDQSIPTWKYWPGTASAITYNKTALWLATLERMVGWPTMQKVLSTYYTRGAFRHPTPSEFFATVNEVTGQDFTRFFDAVHRSSAMFDYAVAQVSSTARDNDRFDHVVVLRRHGDGVFPISARVTFADGSNVTEQWDGRDRWRVLHLSRTSRIARVEVDPDRVLMLDVNYTNNSWTASPRAADAAQTWSMRWLTWLQQFVLTYAFFG